MDNLLSLKDISVGENFDLICKVFHVYHEINQKVWMLFLWDGTDAPPLSLHGKLKGEIINPLPLRIEPYVFGSEFLS
ncbi:hypothetical protein LWI28_000285 [Acer negundo]|uniref:Protection of telomeres protein 1 n=1 Tax=Acer negundo TaxID=4023 RepID=A0AAD5IB97_ACENE|nr:hypothetical protein LWI28_000285 [Acer negundo]